VSLLRSSGQGSIKVVRYRWNWEFEQDAERRIKDGWVLVNQSYEQGRSSRRMKHASNGLLIGSLFGFPGLGMLAGALNGRPERGTMVVTWRKP
jgi:hypothetical protein